MVFVVVNSVKAEVVQKPSPFRVAASRGSRGFRSPGQRAEFKEISDSLPSLDALTGEKEKKKKNARATPTPCSPSMRSLAGNKKMLEGHARPLSYADACRMVNALTNYLYIYVLKARWFRFHRIVSERFAASCENASTSADTCCDERGDRYLLAATHR